MMNYLQESKLNVTDWPAVSINLNLISQSPMVPFYAM